MTGRLLLTSLCAFVVWTSSVTAEIITFLPVGDSITAGHHDGGGRGGNYRDLLQQRLTGLGYSFDFLGTQRRGFGDPDHFGLPGLRIEHIDAELAGYFDESGIRPDFALVLAGTNNHWQDPDFDAFVDRYDALLTTIRTKSPNTSIIISTVPPFGYNAPASRGYWTEAFVDRRNNVVIPNMNDAIRAAAVKHTKVTVVDLFPLFVVEEDIVDGDGVHPTFATGQRKIATLFGDEVIAQLAISSVPEPGSMLVFSIATTVFALRRRRAIS